MKPDVVFFGQSLSAEFDQQQKKVSEADLMLVMGTSLKVTPCSVLPRQVHDGVPRVLINREIAGDFGKRPEDVCILNDSDEAVHKLADALGWADEMEQLWRDAVARKEEMQEDWGEEESLDELIDKYAKKVKNSRKISDGHKRMLEEHLGQKFEGILAQNK